MGLSLEKKHEKEQVIKSCRDNNLVSFPSSSSSTQCGYEIKKCLDRTRHQP